MTLDEFQRFIDRFSTSFITGEFALWRDAVQLPLTRVTHSGILTAETEAELCTEFDTYVAQFQALGVTRMRRVVRSIENVETGQVMATYDTEVLRGDECVLPAYTSSMLVNQMLDGTWRCTSVMNALGPKLKIAKEREVAAEAGDPKAAKAIYQEHLDIVSDLMFGDTLAPLAQHVTYPIVLATLDVETTINTEDAFLSTIDAFVTSMRKQGVTDFIRICKEVNFVSETKIVGWHLSHMFSGGSNIISPYKCDVTLERQDGVWKISRCFCHVMNQVNGLISPNQILAYTNTKNPH